jgi:ketosteroid isomerase-like protein
MMSSPEATHQGDATMETGAATSDVEVLDRLNSDYIRSVQMSDVHWFTANLAEDFLNSNPDGSLVDREGFLEQTGRPAAISNLAASDVRIRLFGNIAIIHGRTTCNKADGLPGAGRYTDVWARHNGRWLCVAAQVTRG